MPRDTKSWTLYYRTGGTERFQWVRGCNYPDRAQAERAAEDVRRMGYKCLTQKAYLVDSIGLPSTWEA